MSPSVTLVQRQANPVIASRLRARGLGELLSRVYAARGVKDIGEVRGSYEDLIPIDELKNAREMASYLADCLVLGKRVLIVADYDCDGATACSVLVMAFAGAGMNFGYLVPDRIVHGYGLTPAIVEEAAALDLKPQVIITVDNGIASNAGVDRANELGIEVLVTDHHLAPAVLPNAKLIVNPNQPGCHFPSKHIAGCGVAWYVARAFLEELSARNMPTGFDPAELLSYVALGTVADVVRLDRNNRILVAVGLEYIRKQQCAPGVIGLAAVSGRNVRRLTCSDIGFGIGPRINAAGRLAHMGAGIECLTTLDERAAAELVNKLNETNEERKEIQRDMVDKALIQAIRLTARQLAAAHADAFGRRSIVVYHPEWHEGVVGVVAGRLKELRHRPTVVMTRAQDGNIKGSGRSIPGLHLKHVLDEINIRHPGVLLKFGGHAMAAGMTIAADRLEEFREALEAACRASLTPEMLTKKLLHDGELPERFLNFEAVEALSQEVWGQGFEEPVFLNTFAVEEVKVIGKSEAQHLKIKGKVGSTSLDVMAFGQGDLAQCIGGAVVAAHRPSVNTFFGERSLQVVVEHLPEDLNPSIAPALREREALAQEAAAGSEGTAHDPGPGREGASPFAEARVSLAAAANDDVGSTPAPGAPQRRLSMR